MESDIGIGDVSWTLEEVDTLDDEVRRGLREALGCHGLGGGRGNEGRGDGFVGDSTEVELLLDLERCDTMSA